MNEQKQAVVEKLKSANNILVTVPTNPSVDQLAACIGLTLLLNKMGKHATAVFSGEVPSTIEFLKPDETIEKNTDSLRDFIIAIDKAKADKLRYKVEDEVVKIFITPYKHSIGESDLIFSQGDFNVDVVMALGIHNQTEVDSAIVAHGRILHDAVVISVNNSVDGGELGSINWVDVDASGVSELVSALATDLDKELLDRQIATALLTGIVAQTDHFGNQKTRPGTMTAGAALLAAGADQQLVSAELTEGVKDSAVAAPAEAVKTEKAGAAPVDPAEPSPENGGPLKIEHVEPAIAADEKTPEDAKNDDDAELDAVDNIIELPELAPAPVSTELPTPREEPTAGKKPEPRTISEDGFTLPPAVSPLDNMPRIDPIKEEPKLTDTPAPAETTSSALDDMPPFELMAEPGSDRAEIQGQPAKPEISGQNTLIEIEEAVHSPHLQQSHTDELDSARKAVEDALKTSSAEVTEPIQALNALPVNLDLGHEVPAPDESHNLPPQDVPQPAPNDTIANPNDQLLAASGLIDSTSPVSIPTPMPPAPAVAPPIAPPLPPMTPAPPVLPPNPAANEPAPLQSSPADQPFTMPLPPAGFGPAAATAPSPFAPPAAPPMTGMPPQAPPPVPPPFTPGPTPPPAF